MLDRVNPWATAPVDRAAGFYADAVKWMERGQHTRAAESGQEALRIFEREEGLDSPRVARTLVTLSWIHAALGRGLRAEAMARRAVKIMDRLARQSGASDDDLARIRVQALEALASTQMLQGRYSAAEPIQQRCLELARETLGEGDLDHASALYRMGMLNRYQNRLDDAQRLFDRAEEVLCACDVQLRRAS